MPIRLCQLSRPAASARLTAGSGAPKWKKRNGKPHSSTICSAHLPPAPALGSDRWLRFFDDSRFGDREGFVFYELSRFGRLFVRIHIGPRIGALVHTSHMML